jgi:hypothetical protein
MPRQSSYCTFDIPDSKLPYTSLIILSAGTGDLSVSYEITSPVFTFTSQKWVKLLKDTKCAVFNKGSDGKYATLVLNCAESPWNTAYAMSDGNGIFSSREDKNGFAYYYLTESELATSYGMIPEEYASVEEYPWIVFDTDGNVLAATKLFAQDNETSALSKVANRYIGSTLR